MGVASLTWAWSKLLTLRTPLLKILHLPLHEYKASTTITQSAAVHHCSSNIHRTGNFHGQQIFVGFHGGGRTAKFNLHVKFLTCGSNEVFAVMTTNCKNKNREIILNQETAKIVNHENFQFYDSRCALLKPSCTDNHSNNTELRIANTSTAT